MLHKILTVNYKYNRIIVNVKHLKLYKHVKSENESCTYRTYNECRFWLLSQICLEIYGLYKNKPCWHKSAANKCDERVTSWRKSVKWRRGGRKPQKTSLPAVSRKDK